MKMQYSVTKCDALTVDGLIASQLSGVTIVKDYENVERIEDGGLCRGFCIERGKERIDLLVLLGDRDSSDGPYDKLCWIILSDPSLMSRNKVLFREVCDILSAISV